MITGTTITWQPGMTLEAIEKFVIQTAIRHFQNNKTQTAIALGIAIRTLDTKLEKYEEDRKIEEKKRDERLKDELQKRARNTPPITSFGESNQTGFRVESSLTPAPQLPLPVSERKEVQSVLSAKASGSSHGKRR